MAPPSRPQPTEWTERLHKCVLGIGGRTLKPATAIIIDRTIEGNTFRLSLIHNLILVIGDVQGSGINVHRGSQPVHDGRIRTRKHIITRVEIGTIAAIGIPERDTSANAYQ